MDLIKHKLCIEDSEKLAQKLQAAKQNNFKHATKPGRWLVYKLRRQKEKQWIINLEDEKGETQGEETIKRGIAQRYYEKLYKRNEGKNVERIIEYLGKVDIPKIPEEIKSMLNEEIRMAEIIRAINKQKINKVTGPDGIPAELYKEQQSALNQYLLEVFNTVLPKSWLEANIILIPKEEAEKTRIQNYRLISLLNSDYKIFASIMAERFKKYLIDFIHSDQNGFLPNRQTKRNIRTILDILEFYESHSDRQVALLFLDAQKAFDNVNWQFMIQQLKLMDVGEKFLNVITAIYSEQKAQIIINGEATDKFNIQKGTRQGCPLSPLLFIYTLEILARVVRQEEQIKGFKIKKETYKLQAYADDLAFILEDPEQSGQKLFKILEEYGDLAGLKINRNKTKIITKNRTNIQKGNLEAKLGIQVVSKLKYLGIVISARCSSIKEDNYGKLVKNIKVDLDRWKNLHLSLLGRIAAVNMNILPKMIFLFQNIPIQLDKKFFKELNKLTLEFVWSGKKARIKLKALQDAKERGGLGFPDWELYYQAAALTWIRDWITLENKRCLHLEGYDLQQGWHAHIWMGQSRNHQYFLRHKVRQELIKSWNIVKRQYYTKIPAWLSPLEAVTYPNLYRKDKAIIYKDILTEEGI
uniref:L1-encoded reverse transcriptase-like protein n=1 Tax=Protobothrops flavoviridis TaxID=88087 RepID=K4PX13_PROFL|nr:L1-encoded reverse transcriptase-like protein [Protobothrops flavoviridis]